MHASRVARMRINEVRRTFRRSGSFVSGTAHLSSPWLAWIKPESRARMRAR